MITGSFFHLPSSVSQMLPFLHVTSLLAWVIINQIGDIIKVEETGSMYRILNEVRIIGFLQKFCVYLEMVCETVLGKVVTLLVNKI
jgi:hypothetical protein